MQDRVIAKYVDDDGEAATDIRTYAFTQRGQDVVPGTATIALPTRVGASPVTTRMAWRRRRSSNPANHRQP